MATMLNYMTEQERDEVEQAVRNYQLAYHDVPYKNDLKQFNVGRPSVQIINMFTTVVRRFAYSHGCSRFLRAPFAGPGQPPPRRDPGDVPHPRRPELRHGQQPLAQHQGADLQGRPHATSRGHEETRQLRVVRHAHEIHLQHEGPERGRARDDDAAAHFLLRATDRTAGDGADQARQGSLTSCSQIEIFESSNPASSSFRKYMNWRYGPHNATIMYPRLLIKLTDLRELNDQHNEYNLKLAKQEVAEIQMQLGQLNLNPYTEWPHLMQHPSVSGSSSDPQARARASAGVFQMPPAVTSAMAASASQAASTSKGVMGGLAEGGRRPGPGREPGGPLRVPELRPHDAARLPGDEPAGEPAEHSAVAASLPAAGTSADE
ncbi:hypothetical protein C7M84_021581 [Penaeus vannamei]|uniref:Uncharacterized protein n=1 Tax=Penaeus vannamei TaxID=6689 RepID=A0A423S9I2_PENVA|nr:hypothetical protein C7M84_021581 [Penaeus vannamei]